MASANSRERSRSVPNPDGTVVTTIPTEVIMSACRCAHCSATGRCQCHRCAIAARGNDYATQRAMNMDFLEVFNAIKSELPVLALFFAPRAIAGAARANETFPCSVCNGRGYNYVGRRR